MEDNASRLEAFERMLEVIEESYNQTEKKMKK